MPKTKFAGTPELPVEILDILPNPVLVKADDLSYVWMNQAFEDLFQVKREQVIGRTDKEVFKERQAVQCAGGDMRVLASGEIDEAYETVFNAQGEPRETITRKSRLTVDTGEVYLVGVMHDITEMTITNRRLEENKHLLEQQSKALRQMANTDALTGCLNRRALFHEAPRQFAKHKNAGSLFLMDIDFFKKINDSHGHEAGDAALVHFVNIVRGKLRDSDLIARVGGEEFAVGLPGASETETRRIAARVCDAIRETPAHFEDKRINMTVSIGVVQKLDDSPFDIDEWLPSADRCLYQAKRGGRDQVVFAEA